MQLHFWNGNGAGRAPGRMGSVALLCLVSALTLISGESGRRKLLPHPASVTGVPSSTLLNINNITMWANADGSLEHRESDSSAGVVFPRGTVPTVFAGGLVWGGLVRDNANPILRVGGQTYYAGTLPGRILRPGVAENPSNADARVFRIRRDWATADLRRDAGEVLNLPDAAISQSDIDNIRAQYSKDWLEWPWQKGAPYYERNGIPGYQPSPDGLPDPGYDEPGLANADQVIWLVSNDLDASLYGSPPIGLELQVTCWAYKRSDELGNVIYQRYRLIYKGTATTPSNAVIDSMYLSKWADTDIGTFSDDLAGCDTVRGLCYSYNSTPDDIEFARVNLIPPAVGYDLVEGPRVPQAGGKAKWDLHDITGYRNLGMTGFVYFTAATRRSDYLLGQYQGTREWWNLMRGYNNVPVNAPRCLQDYVTGLCNHFEVTGDPTTSEGWLDGAKDAAGDRRIALITGPFSLARGDSQEVVIALVAASGSDNRDAVARLRTVDERAQNELTFDFSRPEPVPEPPLRLVELDGTIILDWESDTTKLHAVESYSSRGYRFESYKLYQFPSLTSPISDAAAFTAFDVTRPRSLSVTTDLLRKRPLVNGQSYYYAVTATMVNIDPTVSARRISSAPRILKAVPHSPNPGTIYPYAIDEPRSDAINIVGSNESTVNIRYFDPTRADGHAYKIRYSRNPNQLIDFEEKPKVQLIDTTVHDTLLRGISVDSPPQRVVTRGFTIEVRSPRFGIRGVVQTQYHGKPSGDPVFNVANPGGEYMVVAAGTSLLDTLIGGTVYDADVELRFTGDSSWALFIGPSVPLSRWVRVPYTAWQVGQVGNIFLNRQIYTAISGFGGDSLWRPATLLDRSYNGKTLSVFYPVTIITGTLRVDTDTIGGVYYDDVPTNPDYAQKLKAFVWINGRTNTSRVSIWRAYIADLDGDGVPAAAGTVIRFDRYRFIRDGDEKLFRSSPVVTDDVSAAREEMAKISVFPNPYYGLNRAEVNRFNKFITFSHLPYNATIRIFTLAGELVRAIEKNDPSQFATWDLNNLTGLPVGGGIYLAHLELHGEHAEDLGTKTLKMMIVPEKAFLGGGSR